MNELSEAQKSKLKKIFTKEKLMNRTNTGERVLVEVLLGIAGNFYTKLWEC